MGPRSLARCWRFPQRQAVSEAHVVIAGDLSQLGGEGDGHADVLEDVVADAAGEAGEDLAGVIHMGAGVHLIADHAQGRRRQAWHKIFTVGDAKAPEALIAGACKAAIAHPG